MIESIKDTKSISKTLKDKIEQIRQTISNIDIKQASNLDNYPPNKKSKVTDKKTDTAQKSSVSPTIEECIPSFFRNYKR